MSGERAVAHARPGPGLERVLAHGGDDGREIADLLRRDRRKAGRHAAGMREQVGDRHALFSADRELGNDLADRGGERDLAAVDACEHGGRRQRLGHREQAEDVVLAGAPPAGALGEADRLVEGDGTAVREQHDRPVV